jgi:hypothetical protein
MHLKHCTSKFAYSFVLWVKLKNWKKIRGDEKLDKVKICIEKFHRKLSNVF